MKKILIISIFALSISSCEVCKDCVCTTYQNGSKIGETTTEVCGKDEIKAIEGKTTTTASGVTVVQDCVCK